MDTRSSQETEKERERARIAADLAEFLRRGGVIEQLSRDIAADAVQRGGHHHSPVSAGGFADD